MKTEYRKVKGEPIARYRKGWNLLTCYQLGDFCAVTWTNDSMKPKTFYGEKDEMNDFVRKALLDGYRRSCR